MCSSDTQSCTVDIANHFGITLGYIALSKALQIIFWIGDSPCRSWKFNCCSSNRFHCSAGRHYWYRGSIPSHNLLGTYCFRNILELNLGCMLCSLTPLPLCSLDRLNCTCVFDWWSSLIITPRECSGCRYYLIHHCYL